MNTSPTPILSICLPTMNRAHLFSIGLANVFSEVALTNGEAELIVTDNGNDGDIEAMVHQLSPDILFAKIENAPVIFTKSILHGPRKLARGKYVWIIGDDDMVVRGAVQRILDFLKAHPDLDYVYLNHGWLPIESRNERILEFNSTLPEDYDRFQCAELRDLVLDRFEDLTLLKGTSPFAMFSTIFCYVAKRSLYLEHSDMLVPVDSFDPAIQTVDNLFPHSKLTMTVYAGKPVGYLGTPCFIQGSYHQEDQNWIYKTMILGSLMLHDWLRQTRYAPSALDRFWEALVHMTGRYLARMLDAPEKHNGLDMICNQALPRISTHRAFLEGFHKEVRDLTLQDHDSAALVRLTKDASRSLGVELPKLAIWGMGRRGFQMIKTDAWIRAQLRIAVDQNHLLSWPIHTLTSAKILKPEDLQHEAFDILVLAMSREVASEVLPLATSRFRGPGLIISLDQCLSCEDSWTWTPIFVQGPLRNSKPQGFS